MAVLTGNQDEHFDSKRQNANLHAKLPAAYYVDTMKELGVCPKLSKTDCGTENVLMTAIQSRL